MNAPVVIVGAGLAGYQAAKEIRRLDREVRILLFASDSADFYSKPMLSNAFASKKTPDTLVIRAAGEMAAELDAEIVPHAPVDAVFPDEREIAVRDRRIAYSKLVLAVGADPIRLPIDGEVLSINNLSDYRKFREAVSGKKRVAILGAGLIGCEFADDLSSSGHDVDVFDIASRPLGRLVTPECGDWIRRNLRKVNWHFDSGVKAIRDGRVLLEDGNSFPADVVISAVGLKPGIRLAQDAGIECGRGIKVGRRLASSAEDVYALGDCAEVEGLVLPFVMPIMHASRVLAANLLGGSASLIYPAMPVVVKTPSSPTVVSPPKPGAEGAWHTEAGEEGVKSVFLDSAGRMLGFCLCGKAVSEKNRLSAELPPMLG